MAFVSLQKPNSAAAVSRPAKPDDVEAVVSASKVAAIQADRSPSQCRPALLVPKFDARDATVFVVLRRADCTPRLLVVGRETTREWQFAGESPSVEYAEEVMRRIQANLLRIVELE